MELRFSVVSLLACSLFSSCVSAMDNSLRSSWLSAVDKMPDNPFSYSPNTPPGLYASASPVGCRGQEPTRCEGEAVRKSRFGTESTASTKSLASTVELFGLAVGAAVACCYRDTLAPLMTWNNVANAAGCVYLASKLAPDWLKDIARDIPFVRRLVWKGNLEDWRSRGINLSSTLACVEYGVMGGITYRLRNHVSVPNIAKAALVCAIAEHVVLGDELKKYAMKVPVLRRLLL